MAKGNPGADDHAKVKVRVIEFELEGGNATVENSIRQLTTALTARTSAPKPIPAKAPKELSATNNGADVIDATDDAEVLDAEPVETNNEPALAKAKAPRVKAKPKPPTYLHDLLTAEQIAAFKEFAKEKAPTSRNKQYLVAAYWLKEYGNNSTVNADKIYTCFKTANWPIGFNDWRAAFDNLVHTEHLRKSAKGEFAINPLGEEAVKKGTET